jgi:hypothetical protein
VRANQLHGCIPIPSLRKLEKLQYISMMDNDFCGATISTCTHEEVDPQHWTELTWKPPCRPGKFQIMLSDPSSPEWAVYGKEGNLMIQAHDIEDDKWYFIPGLAAPGAWVVPYSKHLTLYPVEPGNPQVQEVEVRKPFDGIRLVTVTNDTSNPVSGAMGGRLTIETHGEDGMIEARRTMNLIFNKDDRNRLKIAF